MHSSTSVTYLEQPLRISPSISLLPVFHLPSITSSLQFLMTARAPLLTRASRILHLIQPFHSCRHVNHLSTSFFLAVYRLISDVLLDLNCARHLHSQQTVNR